MNGLINLPYEYSANIAKLYEVIETPTDYLWVMEHVKGVDLFEFSHRGEWHHRHDKKDLIRILAHDCMSGLADYWRFSLVHRDLKLENIVVERPDKKKFVCAKTRYDAHPEYIAKIVDFDTVEEYYQGYRCVDVLGTDQYIAPEAYSGYYSPWSDVFAIGVMLYKLITGSFPYNETIFDDEPGQNYIDHPKMTQIKNRLLK